MCVAILATLDIIISTTWATSHGAEGDRKRDQGVLDEKEKSRLLNCSRSCGNSET